MDNERDLFVFTDENGDTIEMEAIGYFDFEDKQYVMLVIQDNNDSDEDDCECCDCCCDHDNHDDCQEKEVFIMEVVENDSDYELIPVDDEKMQDIVEYLHNMYEDE